MHQIACPSTDSTPLTATTAGASRIAWPASGIPDTPVLVYNPSTQLVRVKVGDNTVTATATSFPIPAGQMQAIAPRDSTHIVAWTASGTAALELFPLGGV